MKNGYNFVVFILLAVLSTTNLKAQERTISGKVTDDTGPLPGVSVIIEGTTRGTETDFDGNYSLEANSGDILHFSFIGMATVTRNIGVESIYNVSMVAEDNTLDEVVITALGIKKEKKALGYAVAQVDGEVFEDKAESDVARALQGQASGVNITSQNGMSGSGTNIIIRGMNSFSQSNQALFIVDGVPFSNDTNNSTNDDVNGFVNGNNGSSRSLDLDPNNIESISVLKGLAASTLYGSQGRNGVILITTKSGSKGSGARKSEITINSSLYFNEIASLPDYQDQYGGGFDQSFGWFFSNWGPSFDKDGIAGWGKSTAFDANGTLPHPYSTSTAAVQAAFPELQGARYDWKPYNSVEKFFRTGIIANTTINIRGASENGKIGYNASYGYLDDTGFTPGNTLRRNNLSIGGRAELSNNFTVNATLNYARTDFVSPPVAQSQGNGVSGSGSSVFGDLWFTPRSIDIQGLPFELPTTGGSVYYRQPNDIQHPLWTVKNAQTKQLVDRIFGQASLQYNFNENLNLIYRAGIDVYTERNTNSQNKGGSNGNSGDIRIVSGVYETWTNTNTIWDHNLSINGNYRLTENIGLDFNLGATTRREIFEQNGVLSDGQQVFGVLRHFNFLNQFARESFQERNIVGAYGQLSFDYKSFLFLTLAGRNDWVSNLSQENRALFYPSASLSWIPTSTFEGLKGSDVINYLKIRAGYGESAGFSPGYPIASTLILNTSDNQDNTGQNLVTNTTSDVLGNPDLKPERVKEIEIGFESRWLKNRITLDFSYYLRSTTDLIISRPLDPASGFTSVTTNIGKIEGDGIEIDLGLDIIRSESDGFNWNLGYNFTASQSEVTDLGLDTDLVVYSGFSNLGNAAIEGESISTIYGTRVLRDANGEFVVNAAGDYVQDTQDGIIGDANPDFIMNWNNTLSYKNFSFYFLFSYQAGGDIYSSTISTLVGRGLIKETIDREATYILPGVQQSTGLPNNVQLNNSSYWFNNIFGGPSELQVYDASTLRLNEISLAYNIPQKILKRTPFGALQIKATGFNLWYDAFNTPDGANFDPNTAGLGIGNGAGFDFINGPSTRRYGFNVKATF